MLNIPLAEQLRPKNLSEVIGQKHLLGEGKSLRLAFELKSPHSCIFWGPPGSGKTTIAKLMANYFDAHFINLSAVLSGIKEIREAVDLALNLQNSLVPQKTIVFVDEVHRFNKSQQDAFLPHVENGTFIFVGATTENPSFEINSALLSRTVVYVLNPLNKEDLQQIIQKTQNLKAFSDFPKLEKSAEKILINYSDGDARRLLNALEILQTAFSQNQNKTKEITKENLIQILGEKLKCFDKGGENFYDQISALHKSMRGSDPDAALYWFFRMLEAGTDPLYLARRIIRFSWEDVGLADPKAQQIAIFAAQTYERLGSPEGDLALAQAVIYLSVAPKSNSGYLAFNQMKDFVKKDISRPVPLHLRNAETQLMKDLNFGKNYRYSHNEEDGFAVGEIYFPEGLENPYFYQPVNRGLEIKIAEKLQKLRNLNKNFTKVKNLNEI